MEKKVDILVIGAGPAGIVSAITARNYYPKKKITVIKSIDKGVIPCGIPYMFASLDNPDDNKVGNAPLEKNNVDVVVDEAVKIDRAEKVVTTGKGRRYCYEKLVLAVGSTPVIPRIKGIDKDLVEAYRQYGLAFLKGLQRVKANMDVIWAQLPRNQKTALLSEFSS